jgi:hypothetical protein
MVNHLVEGNLVFTALLEGVLPPERGLDRLGGDPVAAYRASAAALQAAVARPGVLQRSYPGPLGVGSGAEKLQIRAADLLTHGWDLRQATGIAAKLPAISSTRRSSCYRSGWPLSRAVDGSPRRSRSATTPLPSSDSPHSSGAGSHRRCRTAPIGRGRIGIAVPLPRRGPIPSRWGGIEPRRYLQRGDLVRQT